MIVVSNHLTGQTYECEKTADHKLYQTMTFLVAVLGGMVISTTLLDPILDNKKFNELEQKIEDYQELLDNERKLELKK
ncbi:MAG: hypothetical protein J5892_03975 [Bacilli bacterium]|nr:hypothetical protein [Bacilli bacterium]